MKLTIENKENFNEEILDIKLCVVLNVITINLCFNYVLI